MKFLSKNNLPVQILFKYRQKLMVLKMMYYHIEIAKKNSKEVCNKTLMSESFLVQTIDVVTTIVVEKSKSILKYRYTLFIFDFAHRNFLDNSKNFESA